MQEVEHSRERLSRGWGEGHGFRRGPEHQRFPAPWHGAQGAPYNSTPICARTPALKAVIDTGCVLVVLKHVPFTSDSVFADEPRAKNITPLLRERGWGEGHSFR